MYAAWKKNHYNCWNTHYGFCSSFTSFGEVSWETDDYCRVVSELICEAPLSHDAQTVPAVRHTRHVVRNLPGNSWSHSTSSAPRCTYHNRLLKTAVETSLITWPVGPILSMALQTERSSSGLYSRACFAALLVVIMVRLKKPFSPVLNRNVCVNCICTQ